MGIIPMLRFELTRLARGSAIYGVGGMLQRFLGLLLLPLFTRVLRPEDYGIMALIGLVSTGLTGLYSLGTGNSMGLLYFREGDPSRRATIIWSTAALLLFNGTIITIILCLQAPLISTWVFETSDYGNLIQIAFIGLLFTTLTQPFFSYLRMEEKASRYVALTIVCSIITMLLSAVFVLFFGWGVFGLLMATLVGQLIALIIILFSVAREIPFSLDWGSFAPLVRIGFPSIFGIFAFLVLDCANRQILQRLVGLDQLGIFSIGYSFGMVMVIIVGAFEAAWPPFYMSFINRRDDAIKLFGQVLKYYIILMGLVVVLFFAAARPLVTLLAAPAFHEAYVVVGLIAASYMLKGCYAIMLPGVYFSHKLYWQSLIEWAAALVNIALNILLIPMVGIIGAAAATVVSYLILPVLTWCIARKYFEIQYEWPKIGIASLALTFACLLLFYIHTILSFSLTILISIVVVALVAFSLVFGVLEAYERQMFYNKLLRLMGN